MPTLRRFYKLFNSVQINKILKSIIKYVVELLLYLVISSQLFACLMYFPHIILEGEVQQKWVLMLTNTLKSFQLPKMAYQKHVFLIISTCNHLEIVETLVRHITSYHENRKFAGSCHPQSLFFQSCSPKSLPTIYFQGYVP